MGRLLHLTHFLSKEALGEEKDDENRIRQARKELPEGYSPIDTKPEDDPILQAQLSIVNRLRGHFKGLILRRTIQSKDFEGRTLIDLPPCHSVYLVLTLTKDEMDVIRKRNEEIKDRFVTLTC